MSESKADEIYERLVADAHAWREHERLQAKKFGRGETKEGKKAIEEHAAQMLNDLAPQVRNGCFVTSLHALDAESWAECDNPTSAEVIVQALNLIRARRK